MQLPGGPLVVAAKGREGLLRELHRAALSGEIGDARHRGGRRLGDALALPLQLPFALDLRAEPRRARIERLQPLQLAPERVVTAGVVTGGNRGQIGTEHRVAIVLLGDVLRHLAQLLDGALHLHEPPLELRHDIERLPAPLAQRLHLAGHLDELLEPAAIVVAVDRDRVELIVDQVQHRPIVVA